MMHRAERLASTVTQQLEAMGVTLFEVGVRHPGKGMILRSWTQPQVLHALSWLSYMNANGHDIYIRPANSLGVVLLDDLQLESLRRLRIDGLTPAVITRTSPDNYQVWLRLVYNHASRHIDTRYVRTLCLGLTHRYHADENCADWRHFGRLAGFTNRKPRHGRQGHFPFVRLIEATGDVAPLGRQHLLDAKRRVMTTSFKPVQSEARVPSPTGPNEYASRLAQLLAQHAHKPWVHNPDWSRCDFMIARDLLAAGHHPDVVEASLRESPNLIAQKGNNVAQYVRRTLEAAARSFLPP